MGKIEVDDEDFFPHFYWPMNEYDHSENKLLTDLRPTDPPPYVHRSLTRHGNYCEKDHRRLLNEFRPRSSGFEFTHCVSTLIIILLEFAFDETLISNDLAVITIWNHTIL
eukprot:GHVU01208579.1.p2 GENE.GHVU01208579.1~~GHVU01208579.1.p2  ORF type:complete len:110 (-),score=9.45 GHVU01208579.1:1050-1379(-)